MVGNVAIRNHQSASIACASAMSPIPTEKVIAFSAFLPGISSHSRARVAFKGLGHALLIAEVVPLAA
jgi:hypothetical protein